jgi:hypothetical protein
MSASLAGRHGGHGQSGTARPGGGNSGRLQPVSPGSERDLIDPRLRVLVVPTDPGCVLSCRRLLGRIAPTVSAAAWAVAESPPAAARASPPPAVRAAVAFIRWPPAGATCQWGKRVRAVGLLFIAKFQVCNQMQEMPWINQLCSLWFFSFFKSNIQCLNGKIKNSNQLANPYPYMTVHSQIDCPAPSPRMIPA